MPDLTHVAELLTPTGPPELPTVPVGPVLRSTSAAAFGIDPFRGIRQPYYTFGNLISQWLGDEDIRSDLTLTLPAVFRSVNRIVYGAAALEGLPDDNGAFSLTAIFPNAMIGDTAFSFSVSKMTAAHFGAYENGWDSIYPANDSVITVQPDNIPDRFRDRYVVGESMTLQIQLANEQLESLYPNVPAYQARQIWVRPSSDFSDFAGFALDAGNVLETVQQRTTTLTATYDPELEDFDNAIRFGVDSNRMPIIWRIVSTTRSDDGRTIELQLASFPAAE